jgi:hypothetical protein
MSETFEIGVDTGTIIITDPCYLLDFMWKEMKNETNKDKCWQKCIEKLGMNKEGRITKADSIHKSVIVHTGGDGGFKLKKKGRKVILGTMYWWDD